jgi:hypothetical protein
MELSFRLLGENGVDKRNDLACIILVCMRSSGLGVGAGISKSVVNLQNKSRFCSATAGINTYIHRFIWLRRTFKDCTEMEGFDYAPTFGILCLGFRYYTRGSVRMCLAFCRSLR